MNTLRSWANRNNVVVSRHAHARCVAADSPNQSDLFRLEDYRVSSVAAGTIWLIRRNGFTDAERQQRGNIRNLCVGAKLHELEELEANSDRGEFWRDCVAEYILEVKAEMRDAGELVD